MTLSNSKSVLEISEIVKKWWLALQYERKCNSTNEVYKTVSRSSEEAQLQVRELISLEIKKVVDKCLLSSSISDMQLACNAINGCFDNFIHATDAIRLIFADVLSFIDFGLTECQQKLILGNTSKNSVLELLHCLSRILILVLKLKRTHNFGKVKTDMESTIEGEILDSGKLENLFFNLSGKIGKFLLLDNILIDTKNNLAMSVLLIREIFTPDESQLKEYHRKFVKTIPEELFEEHYKLNILKFLLCNAVINTWSVSIIDHNSTYKYLKFFILLCENYSSETPVILNTSRTLLLLVKHDAFKELIHNGSQEKQQEVIGMLLSCIFMLLEHPVACVRHSAKDFLHILAPTPSLQSTIMDAIFKLPSDKRSYFISIGALANEIGSRNLIEKYRYLPHQLLGALCDPTIVSHVSLALEFVILKDSLAEQNFSEWCETWIVPLLILLMKVLPIVAADIDKLLEKAFKKYPNSIFYVTNKWANPESPEELRYIITALKISHKQGFLVKANFSNTLANEINKNESNLEPEKKLINEKLLEHCLHQRDDDIRISTFSLLIEAHKSTKPYSVGDFHLISYFLKYNLNNQQPATRQKILGLVRKMLVRFSDSKATFLKPGKCSEEVAEKSRNLLLYDQFLEFLVQFCFSNIFVGCNFNRLNTVLNILLLCFENIKDMNFNVNNTEYYWSKFLIALDSSYEENKELAVVLSQKLDLTVLKANEPEIARSLFKKAFSLCSHMEPPDVLTGSALLRALMNLPSAKKVLSEYLEEDFIDVNYCSIAILTQELTEQLQLAKLDLMTAAICGPMYGTLFAIRSILKNVNFSFNGDVEMNKLCLAKWAKVLNELVEISFEMTHTVGCVVNSSSPEGHLPMDFQTDFENLCLDSNDANESDDSKGISSEAGKRANLLKIVYDNFMRKFKKLDNTIEMSQYDAYETLRSLKSFLKESNLILCKVRETSDLKFISQLEKVKNKIQKHLENLEKTSNVIDWPATAQVLLLCAWRSIKEASLYLGDLVTKLPVENAIELGIVSKETVMRIGDELKILLCEIKHRGAFEQAYIGFTQLVNSLWKCSDKNLNNLPKKWLEEIVSQLKSPLENRKMKLCSTRRSAGLPFLVQAVICSEIISVKSSTPSSLHSTMKSLLDITENGVEGNTDSKIHALNVLRALFKHAQLGEHVASYVSRALMTAIRGSRGATWSERNSSSLLFSSLIIRIFGVARSRDEISKKNRMTSRTFFQRYSELYEFLLSEMELVYSKGNYLDGLYPKPSLYLVLLILGRLYPPPAEDPENIDLSEFLPYINMSRRNPTMKIRELGARALVPLIPLDLLLDELDDRFSKLSVREGLSHNERHGILLQIKALLNESVGLLDNLGKENSGESAWLENTKWMLAFDRKNQMVPFVILSTYVKVLHIIFKKCSLLKEKISDLIATKNLKEFDTDRNSIVPGMFLFLANFYFLKADVLGHQWLSCRDNQMREVFFRLFIFMLNSSVSEIQSIPLRILCSILPNAADVDDEDFNGIEAPVDDLLIFQTEDNISLLRQEILTYSEIIRILVAGLNDEKHGYFKSKVIHRLWLKAVSSLVMNGVVPINPPKEERRALCLSINFAKSLLKSGDKSLSTNSLICQAIYLMEQLASKENVKLREESRLELWDIMNEFSSGEADVRERIAVAKILNRFCRNFIEKKLLDDPVIMSIWMIPFKLLVDEDSGVRNVAAELVHKMQSHIWKISSTENLIIKMKTLDWPHLPLVSLKAQESLLDCYGNLLRDENLLHLVIQMVIMSMSSLTDGDVDLPSKDEFGVFEKGNPNPFCEVLGLSNLMCEKLAEIKAVTDLETVLWTTLNCTLAKFIADNFHLEFNPGTLMETIETITTLVEESEPLNNDFSLSRIQIRHLRNALGLPEIV